MQKLNTFFLMAALALIGSAQGCCLLCPFMCCSGGWQPPVAYSPCCPSYQPAPPVMMGPGPGPCCAPMSPGFGPMP